MQEVSMKQSCESGIFVRELNPWMEKCILWIHGLGESGLCFEKIVRHELFSSYRHLIPDLPGYGRSLHPDRPLSLEESADHLAFWLNSRGVRKVIVAGHSLGAIIGLILTRNHPDLVTHLIDIDGNKSIKDCAYSGKAVGVELDEFVQRSFPEMLDKIYFSGSNSEAVSGQAFRGYYVSLRLCHLATFYKQSLELVAYSKGERLAEDLKKCGKPNIYIAGHPGGADKRSLELLEQAGVETVKLSPSGHWPFVDCPQKFAEVVYEFLGREQNSAQSLAV